MNGRGFMGCLVGVVALACLGGLAAVAQDAASSALPVEPYKKNDKGVIVAEVTFGSDGKVKDCHLVRSNAPFPLEASTADYIRRKWVNPGLAGYTVAMPINFDQLPSYAKHWNDGLTIPPNLLPVGDPGRTLKLRLTFGADGWIEHVNIVQPTGIELVDRETAIWVQVHWHSDTYAGQTVETPFEFRPPPAPTAAALPKPVKIKPKKTPDEPYAPPAVRVE